VPDGGQRLTRRQSTRRNVVCLCTHWVLVWATRQVTLRWQLPSSRLSTPQLAAAALSHPPQLLPSPGKGGGQVTAWQGDTSG